MFLTAGLQRRTVRLALAAALGMAVVGSLTLSTSDQARAAGSIDRAWNMYDYMLTVRSQALVASQGPAAVAAWTGQTAKLAATNANVYRAALIYGNVDAERLASVTPINGFDDIRTPAFGKGAFKVTAASGTAATLAITAYAMRADIANGVLSWVGMDANQAVCSDPVAGGNNFVNFLTGQDCDAFKANAEYQKNQEMVAGLTGGKSCFNNTTDGGAWTGKWCIEITQAGTTGVTQGQAPYWRFKITKDGVAPPDNYELSSSQVYYNTPTDSTFRRGDASNNHLFWQVQDGGKTGTLISAYNDRIATDRLFKYRAGANGDVVEPTATDTDPVRYLKCVYTYTDGTTANARSSDYRESEGIVPEAKCPVIPKTKTLARMTIWQIGGAADRIIWDEETTDEYKDWNSNYGATCSTQACLLDLRQNSTGKSCFSLADTCDGWMTDPDRDTKYQCKYAGKNEPIQSCYAYAEIFKKGALESGNIYSDPKTGGKLETITTPGLGSGMMNAPVRPQSTTRDCFGSTYGTFDPLMWVFRPIQCAAEWAFAPRAEVMTANVARVKLALDQSPPGQMTTMVSTWNWNFNVSGCDGLPFNFVYEKDGHSATTNMGIPSACPGTRYADFAAQIRTWGTLGLIIAGALAIRRHASASIGFNQGA